MSKGGWSLTSTREHIRSKRSMKIYEQSGIFSFEGSFSVSLNIFLLCGRSLRSTLKFFKSAKTSPLLSASCISVSIQPFLNVWIICLLPSRFLFSLIFTILVKGMRRNIYLLVFLDFRFPFREIYTYTCQGEKVICCVTIRKHFIQQLKILLKSSPSESAFYDFENWQRFKASLKHANWYFKNASGYCATSFHIMHMII